MAKHKRIAAAFLAAALLLVMLGSALFIIEESGHDCIGEGCSVCFQLSVCRNALKNLCLAVFAAAVATGVLFALAMGADAPQKPDFSYTLVTMKVKLSN